MSPLTRRVLKHKVEKKSNPTSTTNQRHSTSPNIPAIEPVTTQKSNLSTKSQKEVPELSKYSDEYYE